MTLTLETGIFNMVRIKRVKWNLLRPHSVVDRNYESSLYPYRSAI